MSLTTPPLLYLITKGECTPANFDKSAPEVLDIVRSAVTAGVSMVQIREKRLTAKLVFELASAACDVTHGSDTKLFVNDRVDIALAAGADGVQLTERSLSPDVVRSLTGEKLLIGSSVHSSEDAVRARDAGANFIVYGPTFATPGKGQATGIDALQIVCSELKPFPVIAIGGIDASNYLDVLEAGAAGVAAIRWLNDKGALAKL